MSLQLYSESFVDVVFGDGPLGFRLGKTDEDFPVVKGFETKEDGTRLPLEGCECVKKGYYIYAVNGQSVLFLTPKEVKSKLKSSKRPVTVRFIKPCSKSHYKTITTPDGERKTQKWSSSDDYLPVRCYNLCDMNDKFIMKRSSDSMIERSLSPIYRNGPLFECDVREAAFNGLPDQKTRSIVWKMLLNSYPYQPSKWEETSKTNVEQYRVFVDEFVVAKNASLGKENCMLIPNPLDVTWRQSADYRPEDDDGVTNESKYSRDFGDSEIRDIIWKDTNRTYADLDFYNKYNKQVLARLLFIFGKLNTGVQYVQGMNELLAPLLYVFAEAEGELEREVSFTVEANVFFAFTNLMSETRDLFIRQMDNSDFGLQSVLYELQKYITFSLPGVSSHFESLQLETQFYAMRWLTTLFARDFPLQETFRLWDSLLSDPSRFMFMYCVGTAMIALKQEELVKADFAGVMNLLQNYECPPTDEVLKKANSIRKKWLKGEEQEEEQEEENTTQKVMKAGAEFASDVTEQMKKGWDVMKKRGIPFLNKFAQETKSRVQSVTGSVTARLKKENLEVALDEEDLGESSEEEKPKNFNSTPKSEDNDDDVAYLCLCL